MLEARTLVDFAANNVFHFRRVGVGILRHIVCIALVALLATAPSAHAQRRGPPDDRPRIDAEAVFYAQPRLIDEAMSHVLPTEPSRPTTYFVGFSAWAEQDVFIREIAQARDIVDDRLGTRQRSLLLLLAIFSEGFRVPGSVRRDEG